MAAKTEEVVQCNSQLPRIYQLQLDSNEISFLAGQLLGLERMQAGDIAGAIGLARHSALLQATHPGILDRILTRLNELVK